MRDRAPHRSAFLSCWILDTVGMNTTLRATFIPAMRPEMDSLFLKVFLFVGNYRRTFADLRKTASRSMNEPLHRIRTSVVDSLPPLGLYLLELIAGCICMHPRPLAVQPERSEAKSKAGPLTLRLHRYRGYAQSERESNQGCTQVKFAIAL